MELISQIQVDTEYNRSTNSQAFDPHRQFSYENSKQSIFIRCPFNNESEMKTIFSILYPSLHVSSETSEISHDEMPTIKVFYVSSTTFFVFSFMLERNLD
jgi:hypothetical protein